MLCVSRRAWKGRRAGSEVFCVMCNVWCAQVESDCSSAKKGGDLGPFRRGESATEELQGVTSEYIERSSHSEAWDDFSTSGQVDMRVEPLSIVCVGSRA